MTAILIVALLATPTNDRPRGGGAHAPTLALHLNDDLEASFGGTSAAAYYAWAYDSVSTRFELRSTDCDGGGSDCVPLYIVDGTDDVVLSGGLTIGGDFVSTEYYALDWDMVDNDSSSLSFDTDGLSCLLCFDTTNSAEKISTGATLELGAALDANGHLISDSTGAVKHGTDGTPGSAGVGDDYFGGDVEVDGDLDANGGVLINDGSLSNPSIAFGSESGTGFYRAGVQTVDFAVQGYGVLWRIQPPSLNLGSYQLAFGAGSPVSYGPSAGVERAADALIQATDGSTGEGFFKAGVNSAASLSEPFACDATTHGTFVVNNDTDDAAFNVPCWCLYLDGTGYDWRASNDPIGTACPYY